MARIRTVKPEHWSDKGLSLISNDAHLLWIGTWNFSDDEGVFENDPLLLKSQVFPRKESITPKHIVKWLNELINVGFVIPFKYDETEYFITRTFTAHQKIDRPTPSKIPDNILFEVSQSTRRTLDESSAPIRVEESSVVESRGESPAPIRFIKPDESLLTDYFCEIGLDDFSAQAQAAKFLDFFNSNGWKVGKAKAPMKDWKAAVRGWKGRMNDFKNENNGTHKQSPASIKQQNNSSFIQRAFIKHSGPAVERGAEGSAA